MKVNLFALCITVSSASFLFATDGSGQDLEKTRVVLSLNKASLYEALMQIERQSDFRFTYKEEDIKAYSDLKVKKANRSVKATLDLLLENTRLAYEQVGNYIVLREKVKDLSQAADDPFPAFTVSGEVTTESGDPMPGVNIIEKETTNGTTTDADGRYSLSVSDESAILVFSFIGYASQEVLVNGRSVVDVGLIQDVQSLEEVVVIGYGTQRSQDVTGSVGSVSMKNVENLPVAGVDQALSGQIAGVQINTSNGVPGGGPQIQVRGIGAVGAGSQPLYVVDGFPLSTTSREASNPINDIPPQDIVSITVLKDASATAIYGSRGANGVVIITTKRGESGKPRVQISVSSGIQQIPEWGKPNLMNAREFAQFKKESIIDRIRADQGREPTDADVPEIYRNPEALGEGTNWFEEITRVAPMHDINLSLSGGNNNLRTYISAGYFKQDGVVITSGYERYSLRANVDANLSQKFKVGINLAPTFSKRGRSTTGGRGRAEEGFGDALVASPIPPVYNEDGTYNAMITGPGNVFPYPNPVMSLKEVDDNSHNARILVNAYGEYEMIKNLKIRSTFNVDWQDGRSEFFHPSTVGYLFQFPPTIPTARYSRNGYLNWLNENTLTYQTSFADVHSFTGLLGYTIQHQTNTGANFFGRDFPDNDIKTFNAAARITGNSSVEEWALISYLARLNYSYKDKYLFTGTIRRDGSSRFGANNRWGIFPSVALGWRLSEEDFIKDAGWLSDLKLRASYGRSGNFEIGNYSYMSQVVSSDYILGGSLVGGRKMNTLGNPNLGWEKMRELNLGLDMGLWNDRIYVTADFYKRNTEDLLLNVEIPRSSGFSKVTENRGNVQNKGMELAISSRNVERQNFSWNTNFNIAFNRNEVLALGRSSDPILAGSSYEGNPTNITMIGKPLGLFYGFVFDGIYQNQAEVDAGPAFPNAVPGNMRVKDINGDGVINDIEDFDIIGNPYPDFIWGMTNQLSYKNFDLRILVTSQVGGERIRTNNFTVYLLDGLFNVSRDLNNRWRSPEQPGNGLVPTTNGSGRGRRMFRDIHSLFVEDNTYVWIKNITLGYNLPGGIIKAAAIENARFYVSIQNALLFTSYSGNPEVTNYGDQGGGGPLVPGYDSNNYPVPVIFTGGINLTF